MKYVDPFHWNGFVKDIYDAVKSLGGPDHVWFRGVTSATSHKLVPSLLRYPNGPEKETALFKQYQQWSRGIAVEDIGRPISDWDVLFEMQHYGIPTRLIDWTEVLEIAVFFSILGNPGGDGAVYVLNPAGLNLKGGRQELLTDWDTTKLSYRNIFWKNDPFTPVSPLAISPRHNIPRLTAQRGRFTIHGVDKRPLEEIAPEHIRKVILKKSSKDGARHFLTMAGINEFTAFPDVFGVAPFIKDTVGL